MGYTRTVDRKKENKSTHGAEIAKYTQRLCLRKEVWWWSGICFHLDLLVVGEEKNRLKKQGPDGVVTFPSNDSTCKNPVSATARIAHRRFFHSLRHE